jgi:hypothetical protein
MSGNDEVGAAPIDDRPQVTELPPFIVARRNAADRRAAELGEIIDAHVEAVLANCRIALDSLADKHGYLADNSDLDLESDTRWGARWCLAGASIAYAHALVDLSDSGQVDTALPTSRTLYETLGVLGVVNDDAEENILNRWLEDSEIQPKKVRSAAERQATRVAADAAAQGVDLEVEGLKEAMTQMYSLLSDASHVRRSGIRGLVSVPLRRAIYGRHPDPVTRAHGAASTVLAVEATILGVGDALASFYGGPFYGEIIKPIQDGLMDRAAQLLALTGSRQHCSSAPPRTT